MSGQLRVAPEHVADKVLEKMGKPSHKVYLEFLKQYYACCKKVAKNSMQCLILCLLIRDVD